MGQMIKDNLVFFIKVKKKNTQLCISYQFLVKCILSFNRKLVDNIVHCTVN